MHDIIYHGKDKNGEKCFIKLKVSMYHVHVIDMHATLVKGILYEVLFNRQCIYDIVCAV